MKIHLPNLEHEGHLKGLVAGIDEAGRGPCAGPLVVCALILDPQNIPDGLNDSKALSPHKRFKLAHSIKSSCLDYKLIIKSPAFIDQVNIFKATMIAMDEAVNALKPTPDHALFDGPHTPSSNLYQSHPLVRGDQLSLSIAAASILAKTHRDEIMIELDVLYPEYGFANHKGYQSKAHIQALQSHGPSAQHRLSWATVKNAIIFRNSQEA